MKRLNNRLVPKETLHLEIPEHRQQYYDMYIPELDQLYPNRKYEVLVDSNLPIQELVVEKINKANSLNKLFPESKSYSGDRQYFPYRSAGSVSRLR